MECTRDDVIVTLLPFLSATQAGLLAQRDYLDRGRSKLEAVSRVNNTAKTVGTQITQALRHGERGVRAIATEMLNIVPAIDPETQAYLDAQAEWLPIDQLTDVLQLGIQSLSYVPQSLLGRRITGNIVLATTAIAAIFSGGKSVQSAYLSGLVAYALKHTDDLLSHLSDIQYHLGKIAEVVLLVFVDEGDPEMVQRGPAIQHLRQSANTMDGVIKSADDFFNDSQFQRAIDHGRQGLEYIAPTQGNRPIRTLGAPLDPLFVAHQVTEVKASLAALDTLQQQGRQAAATARAVVSNIKNYEVEWQEACGQIADKKLEALKTYRDRVRQIAAEIEQNGQAATDRQANWAQQVQTVLNAVQDAFSPAYRHNLRRQETANIIAAEYEDLKNELSTLDLEAFSFDPVVPPLEKVIAQAPQMFYGAFSGDARAQNSPAMREAIDHAYQQVAQLRTLAQSYRTALGRFPQVSHPVVDNAFSLLAAFKFDGWRNMLAIGKLAELSRFEEASITAVGHGIQCLNAWGAKLEPKQNEQAQAIRRNLEDERDIQEEFMISEGELTKMQVAAQVARENKIAERNGPIKELIDFYT